LPGELGGLDQPSSSIGVKPISVDGAALPIACHQPGTTAAA
jgi:hypothetical protein